MLLPALRARQGCRMFERVPDARVELVQSLETLDATPRSPLVEPIDPGPSPPTPVLRRAFLGVSFKCVWVTAAPQVMWSTDSVRVFTVDGGWVWTFAAVGPLKRRRATQGSPVEG